MAQPAAKVIVLGIVIGFTVGWLAIMAFGAEVESQKVPLYWVTNWQEADLRWAEVQVCEAAAEVASVGDNKVTCCCTTNSGGLCCAEAYFCGTYVPGCWCR